MKQGPGQQRDQGHGSRGEPEAGDSGHRPGALGKAALRLIDAAIARLQRWRRHFDGAGEEGAQERRRGHGTAAEAAEDAPAPAVPQPRIWLRLSLAVLLALALGGGAGAFWARGLFAGQLAEHAGVVERLQEEIDAAKKEETRNVNALARFQRENGELRLQARTARRDLDDANEQVAALEKALAEARRPPPRASAGPVRRVAPKSGKCSVGGDGATARLGECLEAFNRP
jgi:hypothetical protein